MSWSRVAFPSAAIIRPQYLVPAGSVPTQASLLLAMYAAARTIPLALFTLGAIYKQATHALLILGALAGTTQLLDAGIGLFEHDPGKCAGPLSIAVVQFFVLYLLHTSVQITPQTSANKRTLRPALQVRPVAQCQTNPTRLSLISVCRYSSLTVPGWRIPNAAGMLLTECRFPDSGKGLQVSDATVASCRLAGDRAGYPVCQGEFVDTLLTRKSNTHGHGWIVCFI